MKTKKDNGGYKKYIKIIKRCRCCNSDKLVQLFSLGDIALSNFSKKCKKFIAPLQLIMCKNCFLVQLKHTVNRNLIYKNYWYRSSVNYKMRKELQNIAESAEKLVNLKKIDNVLDIGCNDGTLLSSYRLSKNLYGIDPAANIVEEAKQKDLFIEEGFFSYEAIKKKFGLIKFKIITAIAMFYDLDNFDSFLTGVKNLLDKDGVFIIQQNYLPLMLLNNAFDNIVHEHLTYFSFYTLKYLLSNYNLEIFNVIVNDINGGSFRVYVQHKGGSRRVSTNVNRLQNEEKKFNLDKIVTYKYFFKKIKFLAKEINRFIKKEVNRGKLIYAYGASTRGNTLLQFCKLNHQLIKKAVDKDFHKWGKKMVGVGIPIISESEARKIKPDYFLVLPWFYKNEIIKREIDYLKSGGKLIFPLPNLKIYYYKNKIKTEY